MHEGVPSLLIICLNRSEGGRQVDPPFRSYARQSLTRDPTQPQPQPHAQQADDPLPPLLPALLFPPPPSASSNYATGPPPPMGQQPPTAATATGIPPFLTLPPDLFALVASFLEGGFVLRTLPLVATPLADNVDVLIDQVRSLRCLRPPALPKCREQKRGAGP